MLARRDRRLGQGHPVPAIALLKTFIIHVTNLLNSGALAPADAQPLIDQANLLIANLAP